MGLKRKKHTVTFADSVNCDSSVAFLSMENVHCSKCKYGCGEESNEDVEEEQHTPTLEGWGGIALFEVVQQYLTSFPIDDASMQGLTQLKRKLLFIQWTCQTKQSVLLDYCKN